MKKNIMTVQLCIMVNLLNAQIITNEQPYSWENSDGLTGKGDVIVQQNSPNSFRQSTVIRYTLPQTGKQAQMVISNIAGNIIRQIPLRSGTNSITIEGGTLLTGGVYYYSLYVGNSLADTKKMILTK